jgi:hypothetical protein
LQLSCYGNFMPRVLAGVCQLAQLNKPFPATMEFSQPPSDGETAYVSCQTAPQEEVPQEEGAPSQIW